MSKTATNVVCPACGKVNTMALDDGAVDGPREYHASCWACCSIQISVDGLFAGAGRLVGGIIEDCGSQFCTDWEESENVYVLIEGAIADGLSSVRVELSDDRKIRVSWNIDASLGEEE